MIIAWMLQELLPLHVSKVPSAEARGAISRRHRASDHNVRRHTHARESIDSERHRARHHGRAAASSIRRAPAWWRSISATTIGAHKSLTTHSENQQADSRHPSGATHHAKPARGYESGFQYSHCCRLRRLPRRHYSPPTLIELAPLYCTCHHSSRFCKEVELPHSVTIDLIFPQSVRVLFFQHQNWCFVFPFRLPFGIGHVEEDRSPYF